MTPDDVLESRVCTTVRFENGLDYEVSARPRKGSGFSEESMISFRPAGGRGTFGIRLWALRLFARISDEVVASIQGGPEEMTKIDAQAVLAWLNSLDETGHGKGGE